MKKRQCQFCQQEFSKKKELETHEGNDHSPRWSEDKIHLSGGDQVILISKDKMNWEEYHKSHSRGTHISFKDGAKRLEQWEKDNDVEFVVCCNNEITFRERLNK